MEADKSALRKVLASWINTRNMQPIVDKITPLIWTDINIVNADGIIVASSKLYRIGKYHNAAHMLVNGDEDVLIIEHTNDIPGVLHGVNFPICLDGVRVGMIGITGVPSEVQLIAKLVRELLQVYITQARKNQEKSQLEQLRNGFLYEWLFNPNAEDTPDFAERGLALGIRVHDAWSVCLFSLNGQGEQSSQAFESIERHVQRILDGEGNHEQSMRIGESLVVMLAEADTAVCRTRLQRLQGQLEEAYGARMPSGVGRSGTMPKQIRQSMRDAKVACRMSGRNAERPVYRYDELNLEILVDVLPHKEKQRLFQQTFGAFSQEELEQAMEMLRIYTRFNGSIYQTAEQMHIHKNSLQYRLNRLAAKTGYTPQNIAQMSYLYILLLIYDSEMGGSG